MTTASQPAPKGQLTCPECGTPVPKDEGYVAWCDKCNWNVQPPATTSAPLLTKLYDRLGERMSRKLFTQLLESQLPRPTMTLSTGLAYVLAFLIHAVALASAVAGVLLLLRGWPNFFLIFLALILLGFAWIARPRIRRMPPNVASRTDHPSLYKLADLIAAKLGSRPIDGIVIDEEFNSAYARAGFPPKSIIFVGLPLYAILTNTEKAAVIAHEVAHGVNGDVARGTFVGSALNTLFYWADVLRPREVWNEPEFDGVMGVFSSVLMVPINLLFAGFAELMTQSAFAFLGLVYHDSQRAEYLADYLAATVSGTENMVSSLEKLCLEDSLGFVVQRLALTQGDRDLFAAFREHIANIPAREFERLRRAGVLGNARLDATHPPTAHRIAFLKAHAVGEAKMGLSAADFERIDSELASRQRHVQHKLLDSYMSTLYH